MIPTLFTLWLSTTVVVLQDTLATRSIQILSYNDVYVMKQVMSKGRGLGGASRVAKLVQQLHAEDPETLVLFSGDTMSPSLWSTVFEGMQMIDAHNHLQLDYASLGNHEFDFTLEAFERAANHSNFTWLNANCFEIETNQLLRKTVPHDMIYVHNVSIGLFGIMYDMQDNTTGVYFTDPIAAAKTQVDLLKAKGAQVIIALTHQHWAQDNEFAASVLGIDLILGGHDHGAMMQTDFGTPYLKADMDFKNVWVTNLDYHGCGEDAYVTMKYSNIPITEDLPTDSALDEVIEEYSEQVKEKFKEVVGTTCSELDLSQQLVRSRETKIGNLIAEANRHAYHHVADVAVMNGGGIRSNKVFDSSVIRYADVLSWCPFGNKVYLVQVSGATLKSFLTAEMVFSCAGGNTIRQNGQFMHPSEFRYTLVCTGSGKGHIEQLQYSNRTVIEPKDSLLLALPDYYYDRNAELFQNSNLIVGDKDGTPIALAIRSLILQQKEICPQVDGRISFKFQNDE